MLTRTGWLLLGTLLCATAVPSVLHAQSQSQDQSKSQAQPQSQAQSQAKTDVQPQSQDQDLLEASRKAKAKKQQLQKTDETAPSDSEKSKVYTTDDFPDSGGSGGPKSTSAVGHGEAPEKGKDTADVSLSLPESSIKRGQGTPVNWSVMNTSDHWEEIIAILTVSGPCNFNTVHRIRYKVNPGGSRTDDAFNTMIYEEQCPGEYKFELRAESNRQVLSSAMTTLMVK